MTALNTVAPLWSDDIGLLVYDAAADAVSYRTACCHSPVTADEPDEPVCTVCRVAVPRRALTVWTRTQFFAETSLCGQCGARLADCPASPLNA